MAANFIVMSADGRFVGFRSFAATCRRPIRTVRSTFSFRRCVGHPDWSHPSCQWRVTQRERGIRLSGHAGLDLDAMDHHQSASRWIG